jgi:putative sigma-54 modulation protein
MKIEMQARNFSITKALRNHIKKRLGFALNAGTDQIQRVLVRLSDINGPRGGADKRCKIHLVIPRVPDIVVEDTDANLYAAIDGAANRAGRALRRHVTRHRDQYRALQHEQYEPLV